MVSPKQWGVPEACHPLELAACLERYRHDLPVGELPLSGRQMIVSAMGTSDPDGECASDQDGVSTIGTSDQDEERFQKIVRTGAFPLLPTKTESAPNLADTQLALRHGAHTCSFFGIVTFKYSSINWKKRWWKATVAHACKAVVCCTRCHAGAKPPKAETLRSAA